MKKELVGRIDVDAGLIWIGDPSYTSDGRNNADDWQDFCDFLEKNEENGMVTIDHESAHPGKAVVIGQIGGEGTYPVYVKRNKHGRIKRIIIDLEGEEDVSKDTSSFNPLI